MKKKNTGGRGSRNTNNKEQTITETQVNYFVLIPSGGHFQHSAFEYLKLAKQYINYNMQYFNVCVYLLNTAHLTGENCERQSLGGVRLNTIISG